jgi:hypothetical protein
MVLLPQLVGDGLETMDEIAQISLVQGVVPDPRRLLALELLQSESHQLGFTPKLCPAMGRP